MKGRFRKGKKAFLKTSLSPNQARLKGRYLIYLANRRAKIEAAVRGMRAAMIIALGASQHAILSATHGLSPIEKMIRSVQITINTAQAVAKSFRDES